MIITTLSLGAIKKDHNLMVKERMEKGKTIFDLGQIMKINNSSFIIASQTNLGQSYNVRLYNNTTNIKPYDMKHLEYKYNYTCTCPDYQFRSLEVGPCKHIYAVQYQLGLK